MPVVWTVPDEGGRMAVERMVEQEAGLAPLLGRDRECARICQLLRAPSIRLVTLTGAGGIGKTRVGLRVAADLAGEFGDGVCFVPLASVTDPELVGPAIAERLDLRERGDQPLL